MKRFLLMIISALLSGVVFTSCEKIDYNKLEGSTWEAKTDSMGFILHFVDETVCTILTGRLSHGADVLYAGNLITYSWRYASDVDSRWGYFHLYHKGEEGAYAFPGTIESKKLYLAIFDDGNEGVWFERKNKKR